MEAIMYFSKQQIRRAAVYRFGYFKGKSFRKWI